MQFGGSGHDATVAIATPRVAPDFTPRSDLQLRAATSASSPVVCCPRFEAVARNEPGWDGGASMNQVARAQRELPRAWPTSTRR